MKNGASFSLVGNLRPHDSPLWVSGPSVRHEVQGHSCLSRSRFQGRRRDRGFTETIGTMGPSSGEPSGGSGPRRCSSSNLGRVIGGPWGQGLSGASMQGSRGEGTGLVARRDGQWSISAQPALKAQGGGVSGVEGAGRGPLSPQQSRPPSESCPAGIQGPRTWRGLLQP